MDAAGMLTDGRLLSVELMTSQIVNEMADLDPVMEFMFLEFAPLDEQATFDLIFFFDQVQKDE